MERRRFLAERAVPAASQVSTFRGVPGTKCRVPTHSIPPRWLGAAAPAAAAVRGLEYYMLRSREAWVSTPGRQCETGAHLPHSWVSSTGGTDRRGGSCVDTWVRLPGVMGVQGGWLRELAHAQAGIPRRAEARLQDTTSVTTAKRLRGAAEAGGPPPPVNGGLGTRTIASTNEP